MAGGLPIEWSNEENVAWCVAPPGFGQSSPVILGGRVYVTAVEGPRKERCMVSAYRLSDGALLWTRGFAATIETESSEMVSRGAPTSAVDDERVYAFFESGDLFALDQEGELVWRRALGTEYGPFLGNHGLASSLVQESESLYLLLDHGGPSHLLKLDKRTGKNVWEKERAPRTSWTTPVLSASPKAELIISSSGLLEGRDLATGAQNWKLEGLEGNTSASPTPVGEFVLVGSSGARSNVLVRVGSPSSPPEIAWRPAAERPTGFASPLVVDGRVFLVSKAGLLSCLALSTGELLWDERLPEAQWASPIAAGDLVWFFGKEGRTSVLRPSEAGPGLVAENHLDTTGTVYGVAAVEGSILVREGQRLVCLRANPEPAAVR